MVSATSPSNRRHVRLLLDSCGCVGVCTRCWCVRCLTPPPLTRSPGRRRSASATSPAPRCERCLPHAAAVEDISETTAARWSDDRVADMSSFFRPAAAAAKSMQTLFSASLDKFVFAVYSMKDLYNKVCVDWEVWTPQRALLF